MGLDGKLLQKQRGAKQRSCELRKLRDSRSCESGKSRKLRQPQQWSLDGKLLQKQRGAKQRSCELRKLRDSRSCESGKSRNPAIASEVSPRSKETARKLEKKRKERMEMRKWRK